MTVICLRSGQTRVVLGHRVATPSTLERFCAGSPSGTFVGSTSCERAVLRERRWVAPVLEMSA